MKRLLLLAVLCCLPLAAQTTWTPPQTTLAGVTSYSVSGYTLVTPPDANLHVWLVTSTLKVVSATNCTAGAFSSQFTWTDPTGANSYTPISIPFGSIAGTPASGASLGGQTMIGPLLIFTSTADPVLVNMTKPTCASFSYAYAMNVSQLY